MEVRFEDDALQRLYREAAFNGGWSRPVVKAYRKVVNWIVVAVDERDFRQMRSLNFEKLKGSEQWSMRVNDQYRLIIEIEPGTPKNVIVIKTLTDYH